MLLNEQLLNAVIDIAKRAGLHIMQVYSQDDIGNQIKQDGSPLTKADQLSHQCIVAALTELTPEIPILSEESAETLAYDERSSWSYYWLVDPLDGTKEFINRNGEFTVNIALIHDGHPLLGVVYAPAIDVMYAAMKGIGAYKRVSCGVKQQLPLVADLPGVARVVMSKSHCSAETLGFIEQLERSGKVVEAVSKGSSLKLCMVAEGAADIYPRLGPTMEWDTAAAQCIVEQSGKQVLDYHAKSPLMYNKSDLLNPWFVVK